MSDATQPLGIGETLRAARRRQGRTLADAAESTRARETYLAALEQEEFDTLGGDVYVRGFIASYAKFLDLDPEPLLETYSASRQPPERARSRQQPSAGEGVALDGARVRSGRVAVLLVLILVVVIALVVAGLGGDAEALVSGAMAR